MDRGKLNSLSSISFETELECINEEFHLDENNGLFINYGRTDGIFPYRYQDGYDRDLSPVNYDTAVLENEFLKAFMPCFGGKW